MLKKRFIAVLIILDGQVVQIVKFKHTNVIHYDPIHAIEALNKWSVDEIVILNVSKKAESRKGFVEDLKRISERCFVPISAGGWITDEYYARALLRAGADKIILNSAFYQNPVLIYELSKSYGKQCIVASMDAKQIDGRKTIWVDRGRVNTEILPVDWAKKVIEYGAGEIFFNSIDHDGARRGYDVETISKICDQISVPLIAFGGIFRWHQLLAGFDAGADAVAVANQLHYTEHAAKKAKKFLNESGIKIRNVS
jgi:cyclase